jgi:hypothetical protein
MLALRKAAWERQREESLLEQRWKLAAALATITDPELVASQMAKPLSTRFAGINAPLQASSPLPPPSPPPFPLVLSNKNCNEKYLANSLKIFTIQTLR